MKKIYKAYSDFLTGTSIFGIVIVFLLAGFICALVFARYVLAKNITGLFDLTTYMLTVFPFLTAAYTLRRGGHISVDAFSSRLPERARAGIDIGSYLLSLGFSIIVGWQAAIWASKCFQLHQDTIAAFPIPKGILVSVMAFGCLLLAIEMVIILVNRVRFLLSHRAAGAVSQRGLANNSLLYLAIFLVAVICGVVLFLYVNEIFGLLFLLLVFLVAGMPVFLVLGLTGVIGLYLLSGTPALMQAPIRMFETYNTFVITAIPLFVLGGLIMEEGKVMESAFKFFDLWTGHFAPSLLVTTILTGALFCAITGSSVAATAVLTALALPLLLARGYRKSLVCGVLGGCTMGTLIPPSIAAIVYGVITEESVGSIFIALIIPAAIVYGLYILYLLVLSAINKKWLFEGGQIPPQESTEKVSWKEKLVILRRASWALFAPIIVLGGIYTGVFTPTEAAGILVLYAIIVCVVVLRVIRWRDLFQSCAKRTAEFASMILLLVGCGFILALVGSQLRIGQTLVSLAESAGFGPIGIIVLMFIVLNVLGMFIPASTIVVITAPIFHPLATSMGIDGVWLGVFYIMCGEMAVLTPPVGVCMYTISGVSGIPMVTVIKGLVPIILLAALAVAIITIFPQTVLWLPSIMMSS